MTANAAPWRDGIGPGGRFVGVRPAGLFWVETRHSSAGELIAHCAGSLSGAMPADEIRGQLLGRISREAYSAAGAAGWPTDPGALEPIVAGVPGWRVRGGELTFDPDARPDLTAPASAEEVQILARNRLFALWACVTARPFAECLSPRFFASAAMERHDRIWVTAEADSARPVHATLVVDHVARHRREVTVKVIERVTLERALPRGADDA